MFRIETVAKRLRTTWCILQQDNDGRRNEVWQCSTNVCIHYMQWMFQHLQRF